MTNRNSGDKSGQKPPTESPRDRGRFVKGNPGKPRGSRHKATQAVLAMLQGDAENITRKAVEMALAGDPTALRLCIERLAPPPKDSPVPFKVPPMEKAADAAAALSGILAAVAKGDLTPSEAERIAGLVETWRRALETTELESRIAALEAAGAKEKP